MIKHEQGLVARLTSQLASRGVENPHSEAVSILKTRGHLDSDGNLTKEGKARQALGAEGRAKDRAAKYAGGKRKASDYTYNRKTNQATLK